jgi:hypothetical protein
MASEIKWEPIIIERKHENWNLILELLNSDPYWNSDHAHACASIRINDSHRFGFVISDIDKVS